MSGNMNMRFAGFRCLVAAGILAAMAGCSTGTLLDDVDTLWGAPSTAEIEEAEARAAAVEAKVPVQLVRSVEMGRTRDGFLITAFGTAPGLGYALPALRPRRDGAPAADGYIEYDFVAVAPAEGLNLPVGTTQSRAIRADLPVTLAQLQGARGLRVLALNGGVEMAF
ncbi:MAG: hypothetical protein AAGH68_12165 [Pseudomonadota bacterium]